MSIPVDQGTQKEMAARADAASTMEKTARLMAAIWERNQPLIEARLGTIERVSKAAQDGVLDEPLRAEGEDVAHKLSGSLGMFGFPEGTDIARRLEQALAAGGRDAELLRGLACRLRTVLSEPAQATDLMG